MRVFSLALLALALSASASAQSFLPIGRAQPPSGRAAPPSAPVPTPAEQMNIKLDLPWTNYKPDSRVIASRLALSLQNKGAVALALNSERLARLATTAPASEGAAPEAGEAALEPYRLKPADGSLLRSARAGGNGNDDNTALPEAPAEASAALPTAGKSDAVPEEAAPDAQLPESPAVAENVAEPSAETSGALSDEERALLDGPPIRLRHTDRELPAADKDAAGNGAAGGKPELESDSETMGLLSADTASLSPSAERSALLAPSAGLIEMGKARLAILPLGKPGRLEAAPLKLSVHSGSPQMPDYPVPSKLGEFSRGGSKKKLVALTFDDGPNPEFSWQLLSILEYYDAPATFFMVGVQAKRYPEWVKMAYGAGHEIASQTYDHFRLPNLPRGEKVHQIDAYQQIIEELTGQTPRFLRPPGGNVDKETLALAKERGMVIGLWDVALNDTKPGREADDMLKYALKEVRPGSVVLAHDGIPATLEMLPELIEELREKGYEFVTMSELASAK